MSDPSRAAAAAARTLTQVECPMMDAFGICLKHAGSTLDVQDVAALLSTSKAAAACARHNLSSMLHLTADADFLQHFSGWLARNGTLLHSLEYEPSVLSPAVSVDLSPAGNEAHASPAPAAAESSGAAGDDTESSAGLVLVEVFQNTQSLAHLQSFTCKTPTDVLPTLVQNLPTSLTFLDLNWDGCFSKVAGEGADINAPLVDGLTRLHALRTLHLLLEQPMSMAVLNPVTQLTNLEIAGTYIEHTDALPARLQRLICRDPPPQPPGEPTRQVVVDLSHATVLTELCLGDLELSKDDTGGLKLPPSLIRLHDTIHDVPLLAQLTSLRHLDGLYSADELAQLAKKVQGLTHVVLRHSWASAQPFGSEEAFWRESEYAVGDGGLEAAIKTLEGAGVASAVRGVRVHVERTDMYHRGSALLERLRQLPNLQLLQTGRFYFCFDCLPLLTEFTALTRLELHEAYFTQQALLQLPAAVSSLPNLHELVLPEATHHIALLDEHWLLDAADCFAVLSGLAVISQLRSLSMDWHGNGGVLEHPEKSPGRYNKPMRTFTAAAFAGAKALLACDPEFVTWRGLP